MAIKNEYLNMVLGQYKAAIGSNSELNINNEKVQKELAEWLYKRGKIGKLYTSFLDYLNIEFAYSNCAEIGKGTYDSVVKNFDTAIITPYDNEITEVDKERVFVSKFEIEESKPYLLKGSKKIILHPYVFSKFMTQNNDDIRNWENLHNSGDYSIIVGAYGENNEQDKDNKIKEIEELRNKVCDHRDIVFEYDTTKDAYFIVVATKVKVKVKELTKTP